MRITQVIRDDVEFFRRYQASNSPAAYLKNVLHLNPEHEIWANPTQYARVQFEKKFWSSNQPGTVVWHESGHYLHEKQAINIYRKYVLGGFADENDGMIAKMVSDYAMFGADEFVAEAFSAKISGVELSVDILKLLKRYGFSL